MFKMFAILCHLVYPDEHMGTELECHRFYDSNNRIFKELTVCEQEAYKKIVTTMEQFEESKFDYETITTGCEKI